MKKQTYKRTGNCGLFDLEENTAKLESLGNPLEKLLKVIDFEMFRETLEGGLYKEKLSNVGAKPYDYVLMFKILVLQRMYNLGDEQTEYQIVDRTSFRNFLGLASGDKVPDARTIWVFKNQLTEKHLFEKLFDDFDKAAGIVSLYPVVSHFTNRYGSEKLPFFFNLCHLSLLFP